MVQIHTLQPNTTKKKKKRVGRGGKRGTYSGKGIKGQRSRAGHKIPSAEKIIISHFPKLRGTKNLSLRGKTVVLNVGQFESLMGSTSKIDKKELVAKGVLRNLKENIKILGEGEVKKAFVVERLPVSKSAKEKIEKAGGEVKELPRRQINQRGKVKKSISKPAKEKIEKAGGKVKDLIKKPKPQSKRAKSSS